VQGDRMRVIARNSRRLAQTLNEALALHRLRIVAFAKNSGLRRSLGLEGVFDDQFSMILPPDIADNLKKAGWSWACVSAVDSNWRTIFVADAHRDDGRRFIVHADEKLTSFLELNP
jgi:hypothetical protein